MSYYTRIDEIDSDMNDTGREYEPDPGRVSMARYRAAKGAKVGEIVACPGCTGSFKKTAYNKTFHGARCKNRYWNTVDERKSEYGALQAVWAANSGSRQDQEDAHARWDATEHPAERAERLLREADDDRS